MAIDNYLQLGDLKSTSQVVIKSNTGSAVDKSFYDHAAAGELFEINDYSYRISNDAGRLNLGSITLDLNDTAALGSFLAALASGKPLSTATLYSRKSAGVDTNSGVYDTLKLRDVQIASIKQNANPGDSYKYSVVLNYGAISETYSPLDKTGTIVSPVNTGWNTIENDDGAILTKSSVHSLFQSAASTAGSAGIFLNIPGIDGGSGQSGYVGWSEVDHYSLGASNSLSLNSGSTGAGAGKLSSTIDLTMRLDASTVAFLKAAETGQALPTLTLEARNSGGLISDLTLKGVHVLSVGASTSDGAGTSYDVSLSYDQIGLVGYAQKPDGSSSVASTFGWDVRQGKAVVVPIDTSDNKHAGSALLHPTEFYLQLTGITGDTALSLDSKGTWIKLASFDLDTEHPSSAALPESSLSLHVSSAAGLTGLLSALATGKALSSATLVGLSRSADHLALAETINLQGVVVTSVTQTNNEDGSGYDVTLRYRSIAQSDAAARPDGSPVVGPASGVDLTTGVAIKPDGLLATGKAVTVTSLIEDQPTRDVYLKVSGIEGGSSASGHVGWSVVENYSFTVARDADTTGQGATKAGFDGLDLRLKLDPSALALLQAAEAGRPIKSLTLEGVGASATGSQILSDLTLQNVHVQAVQVSGSDEGPSDYQVHLSFDAISLTDHTLTQSGSSSFAWNVATNTATKPLPVTGGTGTPSPVMVPSATDYYFKLGDGSNAIHGDTALSIGAGGTWLAVSNPNLDVQSAGGGAKATGSLDLHVSNRAGLTELLLDLSQGKTSLEATIVGLHPGLTGSNLVEVVGLKSVRIASIEQSGDTDSDGYDIKLQFSQISQSNAVRDETGAYKAGPSSSINLPTGLNTSSTAISALGQDVKVTPAANYLPARDTYLKVAGITGESQVSGYQGWSEVTSVRFGADLASDATSGGTTAAPHFDTLSVTLALGSAEVGLLKAAMTGQTLTTLTLDSLSPAAGLSKAQLASEIVLQAVHVNSVDRVSGDEAPKYVVNFSFEQMQLTDHYYTGATSGADKITSFTADLKTGKYSAVVPTYGAAAVVHPTVTGVTVDDGHAGLLGGHDTATLTVGFSETVALSTGGTAILHLSNGVDLTAGATALGVDGRSLVFTYAVAAGHDTPDLKVVSLSLGAQTTLRSAAGTDATLSFAAFDTHLTVDATPPTVSLGLAHEMGGSSPHVAIDPALTGTAEALSDVTLREGATVLGHATADATGHWNFAPTGLALGTHTIVASETDAAGNVGSDTLLFTLVSRTVTTTATGYEAVSTTGNQSVADHFDFAWHFLGSDVTIHSQQGAAEKTDVQHFDADRHLSGASLTLHSQLSGGADQIVVAQYDANYHLLGATATQTKDVQGTHTILVTQFDDHWKATGSTYDTLDITGKPYHSTHQVLDADYHQTQILKYSGAHLDGSLVV